MKEYERGPAQFRCLDRKRAAEVETQTTMARMRVTFMWARVTKNCRPACIESGHWEDSRLLGEVFLRESARRLESTRAELPKQRGTWFARIENLMADPQGAAKSLDKLQNQKVARSKPAMVNGNNLAVRKSVSVLVVDDNLVNSSLARTQLEWLGYSAEIANDGYGALEAVARQHYDIILMDCEMPAMDGYAATAEIRRRERHGRRAVIVAMTAHALAGMRARYLAAGMDDLLTKPVKLLPLAATLDRWAFGESVGKRIAAAACAAEAHASHHKVNPWEDFDFSMIRELRGLSSTATEDVFHDLIEVYRAELSASVAALRSAVANRDVEAIRKLAHALKGSSLTLGACGFGALCECVQKSAEERQIEETIIRTQELIALAAGLPDQLARAGDRENVSDARA
jgi:CheY-like chemotaxis protein